MGEGVCEVALRWQAQDSMREMAWERWCGVSEGACEGGHETVRPMLVEATTTEVQRS